MLSPYQFPKILKIVRPGWVPILFLRESVADLGEQFDFFARFGGSSSGFFLFLLLRNFESLVCSLHDEEQNQSYDEEIDDRGDEIADRDHRRAGSLSGREGFIGLTVERNIPVLEGHIGKQSSEDRHDHIIDELIDNVIERTADDNTDCEAKDITFRNKGLELFD